MVSVLPKSNAWTIGGVSSKNESLKSCSFQDQTDSSEDKVLMNRSCEDIPKRLSFSEKWVSCRNYYSNIYFR